ncbi:flp pilus-assembly TadE/G-like family protein [Frankia sp. CN7]|uniref:Rv3654c family TadE-like protein n=1 Tax=Frankia nepalensis TaxID=1836974 RepID=UPI00193143CD|nr:Rv3654c family TadE-like protein [Frankia nepalensis]MBL7496252.1 flp pilus-assembly TadE/G-like family protein [Frankia nepalensis]
MSAARDASARRRADRGSATVLLLGWLLVVATAAGVMLAASGVSLARRRAATGADLAALAGARDRTGDPAVACERARTFARRNGTVLVSCRAGDGVVEVVVEARARSVPRLVGPLAATARAGPWIGVAGEATPIHGPAPT